MKIVFIQTARRIIECYGEITDKYIDNQSLFENIICIWRIKLKPNND